VLAGLAETRRRSYSSWDLLIWTKDLRHLRAHPAFQDYIDQAGILGYWKKHGYPSQCTPKGEVVDCL
jgi:hypothetical protein